MRIPIFSESQTVDLWDGIFTAEIGATTGGIALDLADETWLELEVYDGAAPVVFPRQRLTTVGHAFFALRAAEASDAEALEGNAAAAFALAGHAHAPGDADTLDGVDATGFSAAAHAHAPGDADTLDGLDSAAFVAVDQSCAPGDRVTGVGADGTLACEPDTHELTTGATDVTATAADVNQALDGIATSVTSTALSTLTGGPASDADALHTHTGVGGGGGCYTHFGATGCATGFDVAYAGTMVVSGGYGASQGYQVTGSVYCYEGAFASNGGLYSGTLARVGASPMQSGSSDACAVCCK
ncbi:MAG: hypothetical protein AABZ30_04680 [Myxococcota bacterium]